MEDSQLQTECLKQDQLLSTQPIATFGSKVGRKNKVKFPNYTAFEHLRKEKNGGGLLTLVHNDLKPVSVSDDDPEEVLVVEGTVMNKKIRFMNAYGPRENIRKN